MEKSTLLTKKPRLQSSPPAPNSKPSPPTNSTVPTPFPLPPSPAKTFSSAPHRRSTASEKNERPLWSIRQSRWNRRGDGNHRASQIIAIACRMARHLDIQQSAIGLFDRRWLRQHWPAVLQWAAQKMFFPRKRQTIFI